MNDVAIKVQLVELYESQIVLDTCGFVNSGDLPSGPSAVTGRAVEELDRCQVFAPCGSFEAL